MNPPPPIPQENGSPTPSRAAGATAASTALPPSLRTRMPAAVASRLTDATAPPLPMATGCLTRLSDAATTGAAIAPGKRVPIPRNAATSGEVTRLFMVFPPKRAILKFPSPACGGGQGGGVLATSQSLDDGRETVHQLIAHGDVRDAEALAAPLQRVDHLVGRTRDGRDGTSSRQSFCGQPHLARNPARDLLPNRHQVEIELDLIESRAGSLADPSDSLGYLRLGFGGWDPERDDVSLAGGQLGQAPLAGGDQDRGPRLLDRARRKLRVCRRVVRARRRHRLAR